MRALAGKELRLLLRDAHGLAVLFAMPTLFILIMSLAMQGAFEAGGARPMQVAVQSDDTGDMGGRVIARLREAEAVAIVPASTSPPFRVALPRGFSERLFQPPADRGGPLFIWSGDPAVLPSTRAAFRAALVGAVLQVQGDAVTRIMEREQGADLSDLRAAMDADEWRVDARAGRSGAPVPSAVQQSVPGWLVFAMFFVVVPLSTVLIVERQQGTELRLRALCVPAWRLLLARVPAYFLVNMLQMAAMLAVGVWLVPLIGGEALHLGAHPPGLLVVGAATSLAAIGFAMLIAVISRTSVQAIALGGTLNLVFGALGGIMVPKMVMPETLQTAALASPMSWALEGFWDIVLRSGTPIDALPECSVLTAFGLASLGLAIAAHARE